MFVPCVFWCFVRDELVPHSESYRVLVSLIVRDVETSRAWPPRPELGFCVTEKQNRETEYIYNFYIKYLSCSY
jgi:hypothetical protein